MGHSTRSLEEFLALLEAHGIELLADVRTIPRSRRNPQFNRETLPAELERTGIDYLHLPRLGGLRKPAADSINTGWQNPGFRGYADHMQNPEFARAIESMAALAGERRLAVMCAESVPWRCHRSLIADALTVRGIPAHHIFTTARADPHRLTPFARVNGVQITYPGLV